MELPDVEFLLPENVYGAYTYQYLNQTDIPDLPTKLTVLQVLKNMDVLGAKGLTYVVSNLASDDRPLKASYTMTILKDTIYLPYTAYKCWQTLEYNKACKKNDSIGLIQTMCFCPETMTYFLQRTPLTIIFQRCHKDIKKLKRNPVVEDVHELTVSLLKKPFREIPLKLLEHEVLIDEMSMDIIKEMTRKQHGILESSHEPAFLDKSCFSDDTPQ